MPEAARKALQPQISPNRNPIPQERPIPAPKRRTLTLFESILYPTMIFSVVLFGGITVSKHNEAYNIMRDTAVISQETNTISKENEELKYEIAQLSSPERIYAIAEKLGMQFNEKNVLVID
ncbi:cell division protein FtsL [Exiguobacterium sp. SH1S21]|uniref:cell division protein FtsL n=1 Tax=Exiguobacterium sp. SH1S21 TaxID=2510953 RepID=UPI00103B39E8|nr:cell division protein FtsL [Exiguobacterium sp. SH1S21]TCI55912.1 cell division protein FtsL [Exiguobacterium sp. SH1S21]